MKLNELPKCDMSVNTTGCCPKFNPEGWDAQELHFRQKPFVTALTRSAMHVPLDMGEVFSRVSRHLDEAGAFNADDYIVLSHDLSPTQAEHLFAASKPVPGEEMTTLSGDFVTKVFEGPYQRVGDWALELGETVRARGATPGETYFFYTTCPKCSVAYGKNYVVGVVEERHGDGRP